MSLADPALHAKFVLVTLGPQMQSSTQIRSRLRCPGPSCSRQVQKGGNGKGGVTDGLSDEESGKEAKRQKSEPTTPISTSSRPPNEYDEVMGITQVDPREAERFEEGVEPEFQDVEEELPLEVSGVSHGGFGRFSLQECLDRLNRARVDAPAPCHSGVANSSNPPQVMNPNVGEEQVHETQPASRLLPEDESQSQVKEERKEENVTLKSEAATAEIEKEPRDHDSEDSSRPEHVAEELQTLMAEFPPAVDPVLSLRAAGPATVLSHKCEIPSLLKDGQIARDNRLPVHCLRLRSLRHYIVILVAMQMSLPPRIGRRMHLSEVSRHPPPETLSEPLPKCYLPFRVAGPVPPIRVAP